MKVVKRQRTAQMAPESERMLLTHPLHIICFCCTRLPIIQRSQHLILENSLPLSPNNVLLRCCNSHPCCLLGNFFQTVRTTKPIPTSQPSIAVSDLAHVSPTSPPFWALQQKLHRRSVAETAAVRRHGQSHGARHRLQELLRDSGTSGVLSASKKGAPPVTGTIRLIKPLVVNLEQSSSRNCG